MIINEVRNEYDDDSSDNLRMSDFTIGEQKDLALNLCLKHPKQEAGINDFKRILFPFDTRDDIKHLLFLISEYNVEVVKIRKSRYDLHLKSNERTKSFLNNGGFTKLENDKKQNEKKKLSREIKQDKILDLDLKLKRFESKIGKKIIIAGFIIMLLSFLITVLTLGFWQTEERNEQKIEMEKPLLNKLEPKLNDGLK